MPDTYRGSPKQSDRLHRTDCIAFRDDITIKIDVGGVAFTLGARDFKGVQCVCLTYTQPRFGEYKQDDISNTLRFSGADCGGG